MTNEPTSTGGRRPNILFLFPDQHRFDWLGTAGVPVPTPNVDALAGRGARFTHAITPSPLCAPARACLAAGREYDSCGVPGNRVDYPVDQTTFTTLLRDWRIVFDGRKKLVIEPETRHVYDLERDPEEVTDCVDSEEAVVTRLMTALEGP